MQTFMRTAAATGLALAMALPAPALAQRRAEPQLQVSYPTDGAMDCDQLLVEIGRMEQISGISAENAQNAQNQGAMAEGAAGERIRIADQRRSLLSGIYQGRQCGVAAAPPAVAAAAPATVSGD